MTLIKDIMRTLEEWAPPTIAQSYDHVGLQVGRPDRSISRVLVALDLTPAVIQEAIDRGAELIITHHPVLFRPLHEVTSEGFVSSMVLRLAESGIACYSIHTNIDAAPGGVSFVLAEKLGVRSTRPLEVLQGSLVRMVCDLAHPDARSLPDDLSEAGAIRVTIEDKRVSLDIPPWRVRTAVEVLREASGKEAIVFDTFPLGKPHPEYGLGAIGELEEDMSLERFLDHVCRVLNTPAVRYVGDPSKPIRTVAVCGGSGSSLLTHALQAGADAFVTSDVTYHTYFDVYVPEGIPRLALIDAGHYETEVFTEELLCSTLEAHFPDASFHRASSPTNPMRTFVSQ